MSVCILALLLAGLMLCGCGGKKQAKVSTPPPPPTAVPAPDSVPATNPSAPKRPEVTPPSDDGKQQEKVAEAASVLAIPEGTKPLSVETGKASWYGAPYHNRRSSNGQIYDMNEMTAAHRTLPLGSTVRVTNLKTGHSTIVRITDRGPFVEGRIVDLSQAAAKQADVWKAGVAPVRLEVLRTPVPFDHDGKWAVQIGSFHDEDDANKLASRLTRRYKTAKVLRFSSPVGDWWVRVRVLQDDRKRAEEVARDTQTDEGKVFLVRLD
ncbi:MAG: septal ring lytic transglycosylase RlpA family protein [Terriglobales bacterium]